MALSSGVPVDSSGRVIVSLSGTQTVGTYAVGDPAILGVYIGDINDIAGQVASQNFLSIFNPVGSGHLTIVESVNYAQYSVNSVTAVTSMTATRITSHTGTIVTPSAVGRLLTTMPDPTTQLIYAPTATTTVGSALLGFPPAIGTGAQAPEVVSPIPVASFILRAGEGVVFNTATGDVDQRTNLQIVWAEISG